MTTTKHSRAVAISPVYYGWVIWAVATVGWIASAPGQSFTVSLFFDFFIEDLGLSRTVVSSLYGAGTFIASLSLTLVGTLVDRYGNRRMGVLVAAAFAAALVLMSGVSGGLTLFLGFIAIRSLGQGSLTLVNNTAIAEWFRKLRGRMTALSLVGFALFQFIYVPWLQQQLEVTPWREMWVYLGVAVAVIVIPLLWLLMRDTPEEYGLLPDGELASAETSQKQGAPIIEANYTLREAMSTRLFWAYVAGRMLAPAIGTGLIIHQVSIFEVLGYDGRVAAETFALTTIVTAVASLIFGVLVDRLRPGWVMILHLLPLAAASVLASLMTTEPLRLLYVLMFGLMMGSGAAFDGAVWVNLFGRMHQGSIRGFISTSLVAGTAVGPVLFGFSYDIFGGYAPILYLSAVVSLIAAAAAPMVQLPKQKRKRS